MGEVPKVNPQFVGKADARDQMRQMKESPATPEQKKFLNRYQQEVDRAQNSELEANQYARNRLKGLSARELTKAGGKQILYGWALSALQGIGGFLGFIAGGGLGVAAGGLISFELGGIGAVAGAATGAIVGYQTGVELAGVIYNKLIRKWDKQAPALDKIDWLVGQFVVNPVFVSGARNLIDGFSQLGRDAEVNLNIKSK